MQYLREKPSYLGEDAYSVETIDIEGGGLTIYFSPKDNAYIYYFAGKYNLESIHKSLITTKEHRRSKGTLFNEQFALLDFTRAIFNTDSLLTVISKIIFMQSEGTWMKMYSMKTPGLIKILNKTFEVRKAEPAFGEVKSYEDFLIAISLIQNAGKDATSGANDASTDANGSQVDSQNGSEST